MRVHDGRARDVPDAPSAGTGKVRGPELEHPRRLGARHPDGAGCRAAASRCGSAHHPPASPR